MFSCSLCSYGASILWSAKDALGRYGATLRVLVSATYSTCASMPGILLVFDLMNSLRLQN